ncbi:MAG: hypothetical protein RLZZ71_465 [Bacteroidota bacterium]|jgi:hypothetical protein
MGYIKPSDMDDQRSWMTSRSDDDTFGDDRSG